MADKIIPDFTELDATPADEDTLLIYDASAGSPRTRSITVANLLSGVDVDAATTTSQGIVELATSAETITGTDTERATTPAGVAAAIANVLVGAGAGDVVGPGSATDNAVARFDSTTGKLIQNSSVTVSDAGDLTAASLALTADLAVTHGGTGASTASDARTNLGLGTIATQAASAVAITGGTVAGITDIAIADGGTGASTATAAFDALSPTTTQGDLIFHNGTDNVRLAKGTALQQLRMNSGATAPEWATITGSGANEYQAVSSGTGDAAVTAADAATKTVIVDVGNGSGTRTLELESTQPSGSIVRIYASFTAGSSRTFEVRDGDGGTVVFSEVSGAEAGYAELAFVSDGTNWIQASPNLAIFETAEDTDPTDEAATNISAFTAVARRYCAASFAATANGTAVSSWGDLSGNSATATQATGGNQPVKQSSGAYNYVLFDGTDDYLDFTSLATAGDDYTVIAVLLASSTDNECILGDSVEGSQGLRIGTYGGTTLGASTIARGGNGYQSGAMTTTALCVVSVKVSNGVAEFKLNGNVVANNANTGALNASDFGRIGDDSGNTSPFSGRLYDLCAWDSAITDDADIITALKTHYGIS